MDNKKTRLPRWLAPGGDLLEQQMLESQERIVETDLIPPDDDALRRAQEEEEEQRRIAERMRELSERQLRRVARPIYTAICTLIGLALIALMLYTITTLPGYGDENSPINNEVAQRYIESGLQETGAVNIVTGMILDYRAFDTLGESTVLFTAACAVFFLLRIDKGSQAYSKFADSHLTNPASDDFYEPRHDQILQTTAWLLLPIILVFGIYIILNGHLSPGGGFSGGAVMASGLIIYVVAYGFAKIRRFMTRGLHKWIVAAALLTYAVAKCYSFYTGANGIPSGIPLGTPGAILSSGLILLLNICVGMVVAATMYAFYAVFRKGGL